MWKFEPRSFKSERRSFHLPVNLYWKIQLQVIICPKKFFFTSSCTLLFCSFIYYFALFYNNDCYRDHTFSFFSPSFARFSSSNGGTKWKSCFNFDYSYDFPVFPKIFCLFNQWDHSCTTYPKLFETPTFPTPWYAYAPLRIKCLEMLDFRKILCTY